MSLLFTEAMAVQATFWNSRKDFGQNLDQIPITFNYNNKIQFLNQQLFLLQTISTTHTTTSLRFCNTPCNNNDIPYIGTHHNIQYITQHIKEFIIHHRTKYNP